MEEVIYSANTLAIFPKFLKFPILLIFPNHPPPNFVSEVVRCGASQKKPPKDSTLMYSLGSFTFRDVLQIAAYHTKLLEDAEFLTHLNESLNATVKLLCSVTCRNLNTDTSLALWYYGVVETCYEYTLLLELCCEVL